MTGEEVKKIREGLHCSRKELADILGTSYETLCRWENDHRSPSKVYVDKLRKLSRGSQPEGPDANWMFLASNIRHVSNALAGTEGLVLGTIHGLVDRSGSFIVARIRLRPEAKSIDDLREHLAPSASRSTRGMRVVGCFVASDDRIPRGNEIHQFMKVGQAIGADHCMIYHRAENSMTLWKLNPWYLYQGPYAKPLPHHVVGGD